MFEINKKDGPPVEELCFKLKMQIIAVLLNILICKVINLLFFYNPNS